MKGNVTYADLKFGCAAPVPFVLLSSGAAHNLLAQMEVTYLLAVLGTQSINQSMLHL
jgi:hypothetical protein